MILPKVKAGTENQSKRQGVLLCVIIAEDRVTYGNGVVINLF